MPLGVRGSVWEGESIGASQPAPSQSMTESCRPRPQPSHYEKLGELGELGKLGKLGKLGRSPLGIFACRRSQTHESPTT